VEKARRNEALQAYRDGANNLSGCRKEGKTEIPKDLKLLLVSAQGLRRTLTSEYQAILAGVVEVQPLSVPFNSARRTLDPRLEEIGQGSPNRELDAALRAGASPPEPKPEAPKPPIQAIQAVTASTST